MRESLPIGPAKSQVLVFMVIQDIGEQGFVGQVPERGLYPFGGFAHPAMKYPTRIPPREQFGVVLAKMLPHQIAQSAHCSLLTADTRRAGGLTFRGREVSTEYQVRTVDLSAHHSSNEKPIVHGIMLLQREFPNGELNRSAVKVTDRV